MHLKQAIRQLTGEDTNTSKKASIGAILYQNTPSPLQDQTTITYQLSKENVEGSYIEIYDFSGNAIKRFNTLKPGKNSIEIQSSILTSRISFYRLIVKGEVIDTKKMLKG